MEELDRISLEVAIDIMRAHAKTPESECSTDVAAAQEIINAAVASGIRVVRTPRGFYFLHGATKSQPRTT